MKIIAHRGRHEEHTWPENTKAAVCSVWDRGILGVEVDVWVTRDEKVVLSHDKDIIDMNDQKYDISKTSFTELSGLNVGNGISPSLLFDVVKMVPKHGQIFVEIKCGQEIVAPLGYLLSYFATKKQQIKIIGFIDNDERKETMRTIISRFPQLEVYALFGSPELYNSFNFRLKDMNEFIIQETIEIQAKGIDIYVALANQELFKNLKEKDLSCHIWNVNTENEFYKVKQMGSDSITTDYPKTLSHL